MASPDTWEQNLYGNMKIMCWALKKYILPTSYRRVYKWCSESWYY